MRRIGVARAVVFAAEFLVAAAVSVALFPLLSSGPLLGGNPTAAACSYGGISLLTIVAGTVLATRARTV